MFLDLKPQSGWQFDLPFEIYLNNLPTPDTVEMDLMGMIHLIMGMGLVKVTPVDKTELQEEVKIAVDGGKITIDPSRFQKLIKVLDREVVFGILMEDLDHLLSDLCEAEALVLQDLEHNAKLLQL